MLKRLVPKRLKDSANKWLEGAGYHYQRKVPIDFCGVLDDPILALQRAKGNPVIVDVPIEYCRGLEALAFSCASDSNHPFILSVQGIVNKTQPNYIGSWLENYYLSFKPKNIVELCGFKGQQPNPELSLSPLAFIHPWFGTPNKSQEIWRRNIEKGENKAFSDEVSIGEGCKFFGPVSKTKGEVEFGRLKNVVNSILEKGYYRHDGGQGDIRGYVLVNDNEFVIEIISGQHRIAALAGLGYETVPIRIGQEIIPVVRRNEYKSWPGVINGGMSAEQALSLFDRIFEAQQPSTCEGKWSPTKTTNTRVHGTLKNDDIR